MARRIALFLGGFLLLCGSTVLFPRIDLWASGLFYRPGADFFLADWPLFAVLRDGMRPFVAVLVILELVLLAATLLRRRAIFGIDGRAAAFLLIALAVGPGLVVNTALKDHWGRARPVQVTEFGGDKHFTPAFVPSGECYSNCSFPAGDPATGFYLVSAALLISPRRGRRAGIAAAVALGAILGVTRIAQGGHFLSDVIASGFLVFATSWLLYRWIVVNDGLTALWHRLRHPPQILQRLTMLGVLTAVAVLLSYRFLDRPLALALQHRSPAVEAAFRVSTAFGVSTGYLVVAALLALGFAVLARRAQDPAKAGRLALAAWRSGFIFTAVAGAGLIGDILKPIFGRARPRLFLENGIYGFTGHGARANYWSFPSGHTVTIVALALSLSLLHRRGMPFYAAAALLVMASRVILTEHYLSDIFGGAFLAIVAVMTIRYGFRRAGSSVFSDNP